MEKFEALQKSPLFAMLSPPEVELAAEMSRPKRLARGEVVFHEGDLGDSLYVVASGSVELVLRTQAGAERVVRVIDAPDFFGEMSLVDKDVRSATVRARTDALLLQLTAENLAAFRRHFRDGFTFLVLNIARALSGRLREANNRLVARL